MRKWWLSSKIEAWNFTENKLQNLSVQRKWALYLLA